MIVTVPKLKPVSSGGTGGKFIPAGTKTLGCTLAVEGSLLVNVMVRPPGGAGVGKANGSGPDWPSPTVQLGGKEIVIASLILMVRLAPV